MYVHMCILMHSHVYTCIHLQLHMHTPKHAHTHVCSHTHALTYVHTISPTVLDIRGLNCLQGEVLLEATLDNLFPALSHFQWLP